MKQIKSFVKKSFSPWIQLGAVTLCAIAITIKLIFYYQQMGVASYIDVTILLTLILWGCLFSAFKNKVIPLILYFLASALMVADVTYFSFFNRFLSVSTAGAVRLLGDVQDSIWEIMNPATFWLCADCVIIAIVCCLFHLNRKMTENRENQDISADLNDLVASLWMRLIGDEGRMKTTVFGFILISCLMIMNPAEGTVMAAVTNQEFTSYHLRDISGITEKNNVNEMSSIGEILAITGDYDQEKVGPEFGIAEGRNLIVIQVEALQNFVIGAKYKGKEITPNMNALLNKDTFYFDSYYQQLGSGNTSDSEFATNNSLYGSMKTYTYEIYQENYFRGLPVLLKEKGYKTLALHAFDKDFWSREAAYPGQGFDVFYSAEDFKRGPILGMGLADKAMFEQTIDILGQYEDPFYAFVVTLSSHHPFDIGGELDIDEDTESTFENYLQSISYVDAALGEFIEELKAAGLYENTVIALYGDHFGLNPKDEEVNKEMSDFLGEDYWYEQAMNIPLFIHVPDSGMNRTVSVVGGQVDFLPTIAYLMGFETLDTIHFGHNLLTVQDNFVPIRAYIQRGSFVTGDVMFQMAANRIFSDGRGVNIRSKEEIDTEGMKALYVKSVQLTNTSDYYLEQDILRKIYLEGRTLTDYLGIISDDEKQVGVSMSYNTTIIDGTISDGAGNGVYCRENLDELYAKGCREIMVHLLYTSDGRMVVMKDSEDVHQYFEQPQASYTYLEFERAKKKLVNDQITPMTIDDLTAWMKEHADATIVLCFGDDVLGENELPQHSIYLIKGFSEAYPELQQNVRYFLNSGEEVERANLEGHRNVIFNISGKGYSEQQIMDFAALYKMYAIVVAEPELNQYLDLWANWDGALYVFKEQSYDQKTLEQKGLTGVIIEGSNHS